MKKIILICSLLVSVIGFGQSVVGRSSTANTVKDGRVMDSLNLYVPRYRDTTTANLTNPNNIGIDTTGAIIYTYDIKAFWYRQHSPKKWVRIVGDNLLSNNFFFDSSCNCYKIDTTSLINIVNAFNKDSSVTSISVVNDSTIRICYGDGTCVNIGIVTTVTNINNVYFVSDSSIAVCNTSICDTITITKQQIIYYFQNGLYENSKIIEWGNNGNSLLHNTTINTGNYVVNFSGYPSGRYPYTFNQEQGGLGSPGITQFVNPNYNDNLGVLHTDSASAIWTGWMGDKVGYFLSTNLTGNGTLLTPPTDQDLTVKNTASKLSGIFLHTLDTSYKDAVTIYGAPTSAYISDLIRPFQNYRIATFKTDKAVQFFGYNSSNNLVTDTGRYKIAVFDTLDGTIKKRNWNGLGGMPPLNQYHFFVGDASNTAVDAGSAITWNGSRLQINSSAGTETLNVEGNIKLTAGGYIKGVGSQSYAILSDASGSYLVYGNRNIVLGTSSIQFANGSYGTILNTDDAGNFQFFKQFPQYGSAGFGVSSSVDASAVVQIDATSTPRGILIPRMTAAQKTAIATPATSLLVYQTDGAAGYWYYNGSAWVPFTSAITADNGLTASTSTNVQLGGTFTKSDTLNFNNFNFRWIGGTGNVLFTLSNTSQSFTVNNSSSGVALWGISTSGYGGYFNSTSGIASHTEVDPSSTNTIIPIAEFTRNTQGTAANGIGGSLDFYLKDISNANPDISNQLISKWTDATTATRTSQFIITGVNSGVTNTLMTADGSGKITMSGVGSPSQTLSVTNADGNQYGISSTLSGAGIAVAGVVSDNGVAVLGQGTTGNGVKATATTGVALYVTTSGDGGLPGRFYSSSTNTNTIIDMVKLETTTSGTAANGFGGALRFDIEATSGASFNSNNITSIWTDATTATRTSQMKFTGVQSASAVDLMTLNADGSIQLRPITATAASAITPAEGMMLFVSSTDATFTSIGFWGYQNGAWHAF